MKKIIIIIIYFLIITQTALASVDNNAKIRFLHHSTGGNLYSQGNVADWFSNYNTNNGTNYSITEINYPTNGYPWNNYPYDWWNLWVTENSDGTPRTPACQNGNANMECLNNLVSQYDVIIFKQCFPGADIQPDTGNPDVTSSVKTLENYKEQYRAIRKELDKYPNNLFIVWTLVPLHRLATNAEEASRAKQFVDWVKNDWLTEDGQSHPNIKIFDFWGQVAETNPNPSQGEVNTLKYEYERSHTDSDSHPNTLANQTVGPIFAQSIVDDINEFQNENSDINVSVVNLITKVDFEGSNWQEQFQGQWSNYSKVVTANPHKGMYSLRGNLFEDRIDPITGLPGNNSAMLDFYGNDFISQTPHGVFVRYWRKFDDAIWQGSLSGHGKAEYLLDENVGVGAYYTRTPWDNMDFALSWNGSLPEDWHYQNWGHLKVYLGNSELSFNRLSDGQWHKIEYYVNYDEDYIMMWFDDYLLYGIGSYEVARDGKIPIHPNFKLKGIGFLYVNEAQVENSIDGNGYACGWQLDDIEIWDGIPSDIEIHADVNQDNQINTTDAMLTLRNSLGLDMSQTNWQNSSTTGDVNCDNVTNSTDAMLILRKSLGLDMENTGWCVE